MQPSSGAQTDGSTLVKMTVLGLIFTTCYLPATQFHRQQIFKPAVLPPATIAKETTPAPAPKKKKKKTIYLTFDDGPNKGTNNVLDIINGEQVQATLFVVGEHVYASRQQAAVYDSILSSKFVEVANHSYSHAFHNRFTKFYSVPDSMIKDFKRCADSLALRSNIVRTPGRNIWRTTNIHATDIGSSKPAADSLAGQGFTVMGWDLEWHFGDSLQLLQSTEEMASQVDSMFAHKKNKTEGHLVLLAHDQVYRKSKDSLSLRKLIALLKEKGEYDFATVSAYPLSLSAKADSLHLKK